MNGKTKCDEMKVLNLQNIVPKSWDEHFNDDIE